MEDNEITTHYPSYFLGSVLERELGKDITVNFECPYFFLIFLVKNFPEETKKQLKNMLTEETKKESEMMPRADALEETLKEEITWLMRMNNIPDKWNKDPSFSNHVPWYLLPEAFYTKIEIKKGAVQIIPPKTYSEICEMLKRLEKEKEKLRKKL